MTNIANELILDFIDEEYISIYFFYCLEEALFYHSQHIISYYYSIFSLFKGL